MTEPDTNAIDHVYRAAEDLEDTEFNHQKVVKAHHEYEHLQHGHEDLPNYRAHVTIKNTNNFRSTFSYPVVEYAREEWGLYLFDSVAHWDDETVTLRLGYDPEAVEIIANNGLDLGVPTNRLLELIDGGAKANAGNNQYEITD